MIIVIGRAEVEPQAIAQLRPALDAMMRATWDESGCLSYSMAVESESEGVITVVERWADEAALQAHFASPHMAAFKAAALGVILSMDVKLFDVTGERSLAL